MSKRFKEIEQVAVIGAGRFGIALVKSLIEQGKEVLAIDINETAINKLTDIATATVVADASDENVLEAIDIKKFDAVVICIGENLQASALVTLTCKQMGVPYIISKASTEQHKLILEKIGADMVIVPEIDSGKKLANYLTHPSLSDVYELTENYLLAEISAVAPWFNKSLINLDLRRIYGVNIIIIKRGKDVIINPDGNTIIQETDILVLGGGSKDIDTLCRSIEDL